MYRLSVIIIMIVGLPIFLFADPGMIEGFPIEYQRTFSGNSYGKDRGPLVCDIDKDGYPDIAVVSSSDLFVGINDAILIYDGYSSSIQTLTMPNDLRMDGYTFSQTVCLQNKWDSLRYGINV